MAAINTAVKLAEIRAKIDAQQQVVSDLEMYLQRTLVGESIGNLDTVKTDVISSYTGIPDGTVLATAFTAGLNNFKTDGTDADATATLAEADVDQTAIRQMLAQARSMLGELRIEEQQWNQEVNQEKERRKDLLDFAKG